jgi:photosystem II stability/assembly factor-like uncharacterized protein
MARRGVVTCRREHPMAWAFRTFFVAAAQAALAAAAFAAEPGIAPAAPGNRPVLKGAADVDPGERIDSQRSTFGPYLDEAYKANILRELAKKNALYANQLPGADHPKGMPVWESIGPATSQYAYNGVMIDGIDSGRIRTILPHPTDPDRLYVLTSGGGLWKTDNFRQKKPDWKVLTDALVSTSGGSAALGRNFNTVYLGIGDPFDVLSTVAGVMVKTTDGGRSWGGFVNLAGATAIRDVKVDTSGAQDIVLVATDVGLFRSTDGGASYAFSSVGQADNQTSAWSLARTSAGWLLATVDADFLNTAAGGPGKLYVSGDRGATWSPIPNGNNAYSNLGRATLAVAAPGERIVYAIASDPTGFRQSDLYKSVDGGLNWVALGITNKTPANPNCFQNDMNIIGDQAWYNQMVLVAPGDASRNTVYIGGNLSTAKTSDGGATWTLTSSWLPTGCDYVQPALPYVHADNHAASASVFGGRERLIFGTDGGIFVSTDAGASFDSGKNRGIVSLLSQTISSTPKRADSAITGLQDTGTRARFKGSEIWNQVFGGDGEGVGWSQANNAITLATVPGSGIVTRPGLPPNTGNPNDWQDGTNGINFTDPDCFPFYTPIGQPTAKADPTGLVFYTATGSRLYKTTDGAASWQQVVQFGSSAAPICYIRLRWHAIGLHPSNDRQIALTGVGGRLLITKDGGASWTIKLLTTLVPGWTGFNSAAAWTKKGTLYVASESPLVGAVRFAKSADGGNTWVAGGNGLPDVAISDIAVDPADKSGNTVYAGTWIGVYVTRDGGANWTLYGAGLPNVDVTGLYLSPEERFLRVATYGRGVWEIDLPGAD